MGRCTADRAVLYKAQILEMYMNYVFLGAGAYGFEAGVADVFRTNR